MRRFQRDHEHGQFTWLIVVALTSGLTFTTGNEQANVAAALAWGGVVGAFWQIRSRRDLADRFFSVVKVAAVLLVIGLAMLPFGGEIEFGNDSVMSAQTTGIVLGLVLAEQWMRWSARRESAGSPTGSNDTTPDLTHQH